MRAEEWIYKLIKLGTGEIILTFIDSEGTGKGIDCKFLKKINLKYIVLCENLSISGINTAGIPDNVMKTLILDIKFDQKYFERVIHHEVFHIINDQHKELFNENKFTISIESSLELLSIMIISGSLK